MDSKSKLKNSGDNKLSTYENIQKNYGASNVAN